jgi:hypothetical protein
MATFSLAGHDLDAVKLQWGAVAALPCLLALLYLFSSSPKAQGKTPDSLPEWIPGVTNMYQYLFHNMDFIHHAMYVFVPHSRTLFTLPARFDSSQSFIGQSSTTVLSLNSV